MSACHDIENQMLDWLYGDLPDAESRALERHLEGCASCAAQAKTLGETRRAFSALPLEEPPAAMTALLMHEAGKRASKKTEAGLFTKFASWLGPLAQHPGLAAAATLVVVVTVVGTVYVRQGKDLSGMNAAEPALEQAAPATPAEEPAVATKDAPMGGGMPTPVAAPVPEPERTQAKGDLKDADGADAREPGNAGPGYRVDIASDEQRQKLRAAGRVEDGTPLADDGKFGLAKNKKLALDDNELSRGQPADEKKIAPPQKERSPSLEEAEGGADVFAEAPAPPPSAASGQARAEESADDIVEADKAQAPSKQETARPKASAPKEEQGGQTEVAQIQSALKFNRCAEAVRVADKLRSIYPSTYESTFGKSKTLENCRRQINSSRKRATEKPATKK